jgi:hypothetical protein
LSFAARSICLTVPAGPPATKPFVVALSPPRVNEYTPTPPAASAAAAPSASMTRERRFAAVIGIGASGDFAFGAGAGSAFVSIDPRARSAGESAAIKTRSTRSLGET